MDDFKYYSEKLDGYKIKYQEAIKDGDVARINQIVRDASFVCTKLYRNVVFELSIANLPGTQIAETVIPPVKKAEKKLCFNDCGNESPDEDCCSKRCKDQFKVKKYRQKKKQEQLSTILST